MYLDSSELALSTPMARLGMELATRHYWLSRTERIEAGKGKELKEKVEAQGFWAMQGWTTEDRLLHHLGLCRSFHGPHRRARTS